MCGGKDTECYERGVDAFFDARGEVADGVQLEEVIAFLDRERERRIDEIMAAFDAHNDNMMAVLEEAKVQFESQMTELVDGFNKFNEDFNAQHGDFWDHMAESVSHEICLDEDCFNHAMEVYHEEAKEITIGREEIRNFILFVEGLSEIEPQPLIDCV